MADTDLLTLVEGYLAINDKVSADAVDGGQDGAHDDEMRMWISGISERIDELCGPVIARTVTVTRLDAGGSCLVVHNPVLAIDSVSVRDRGGDSSVLDPSDYEFELLGGTTFVHHLTGAFGARGSHATVSYQAGRATTAEDVPRRFKVAAASILRRVHARDAGSWSTGGDPMASTSDVRFFKAIDPMVTEWLSDDLRGPVVA